jgi:hypothetical protein
MAAAAALGLKRQYHFAFQSAIHSQAKLTHYHAVPLVDASFLPH